jgi:hypothetical protein
MLLVECQRLYHGNGQHQRIARELKPSHVPL